MNKKIRVLIIQPHGMGDQIMITPLLKLLKSNYRNIVIRIVVSSIASKAVIENSKLVDEIEVFNRNKENIFGYFRLIWKNFVFSPNISYVAPYTNLILGQVLSFCSGAKIRIGEDKSMPIFGYTHYNPKCLNMHKVDANIFLFNIGLRLSKASIQPYFYLKNKELLFGEDFFTKNKLNDCTVMGLHVGCDQNSKYRRYPLNRFQKIIDTYIELSDSHKVVCFFGPDEVLLSNLIKSNPNVFIVQGRSIQCISSIIKKVDVMLTTDSGLGHIAVAFKTPCVSIMGPADSLVTSPYGSIHSVVETNKKLSCKPCIHTKEYINCTHFDCLNTISEDDILLKVLEKI
jgi:heptosyltransferase I